MTTTQDDAASIAADTDVGARAIGRTLDKTERQALHLCATGQLPAFKLGGRWCMRRSTYAAYIARLEQASVGAPADQ
jgi:hypothetical protein